MSAIAEHKMDSLGLDGIGDLSGLLNEQDKTKVDGPLELDLKLIDEDPNQPRTEDNPGFSKSSLNELAITIRHRGVKTPISVRENPDSHGRFIINHGARRFRSSKIAEKTTIPAFIDNDYNEADQVIENLQRNELTAREIADYIGRELAKGMKKGDIANSIGKSAAFVSQHVTLLDLPVPIAEIFNSGRSNDVTVINELVKAYKKNSEEVNSWLSDEAQELTRGSVKLLREYLAEKQKSDDDDNEDEMESNHDTNDDTPTLNRTENDQIQSEINEDKGSIEGASPTSKAETKEQDSGKLKKAIVIVKHDERMARLMLNQRPSSEGFAWIKYEDDGHEFETDIKSVELISLIEGT